MSPGAYFRIFVLSVQPGVDYPVTHHCQVNTSSVLSVTHNLVPRDVPKRVAGKALRMRLSHTIRNRLFGQPSFPGLLPVKVAKEHFTRRNSRSVDAQVPLQLFSNKDSYNLTVNQKKEALGVIKIIWDFGDSHGNSPSVLHLSPAHDNLWKIFLDSIWGSTTKEFPGPLAQAPTGW